MSFKDMTPEQRSAMAKKSAETRRANKALREPATPDVIVDEDEIAWHVEQAERHFAEPEIVYGEIEEPAIPEPALEAVDTSPFGRFLAGVPASTRSALSLEELRDIYDAQTKKAEDEKKARAKKAVAELAANAARMEAGLVPQATIQDMETAKRNAELVRFTVELPPAGDNGEVADIGLRVDQRVFLHGHTYTLTRAQADSFRDNIYRAREMELTFKGQNRRMRQYMQSSMDSNRWHVNLNPDGSLARNPDGSLA